MHCFLTNLHATSKEIRQDLQFFFIEKGINMTADFGIFIPTTKKWPKYVLNPAHSSLQRRRKKVPALSFWFLVTSRTNEKNKNYQNHCLFHYIFWSLGFGYQSELSHMFTSITNVNLALFFNKFTRYLKRDQARFAIFFYRKRNKYDSWLWYLHTHNQKVTKICIEPGT